MIRKTALAAALEKLAQDPQERMIVGVDLAKKFIQVCYREPDTSKIINHQLSRKKFWEFLKNPPFPALTVAMEACGSSNYWAQVCVRFGHLPMIIPAETVYGFHAGNKDDANDARCIWQVAFMPEIKTIRPRDQDNQMMMALLRRREETTRTLTREANSVRAMLYEMGVACPEGPYAVMNELQKFCKETDKDAPNSTRSAALRVMSSDACNRIKTLISSLQTMDDFIISYAENDPDCRLLMTIPYIGPLTAVTILIAMGDPDNFPNGRALAAYFGFAPCHTGTGGNVAILGIPTKGNRCVKRMLYEPALAMYTRVMKPFKKKEGDDAKDNEDKVPEPISQWIFDLAKNKPVKKVVCAIVNKLCRICWAVLKHQTAYVQSKSSLVPPSVTPPEGKVKGCRAIRKAHASRILNIIESFESYLDASSASEAAAA